VAEGSGCSKMFECMYHGWQYGVLLLAHCLSAMSDFITDLSSLPSPLTVLEAAVLCKVASWMALNGVQTMRGASGEPPS